MQHDNIVSLPAPVKCQECSIAVEGLLLGHVPDEPVYLGFLEIASPFDRTFDRLWIDIEMELNSLYSIGFYLRLLSRENVVRRVIQDEFEKRKTHLLASIEKEFVENGYDVPDVRQVDDVTSLVVPKNTSCRLFFNKMIHIRPVSSEKEHIYDLSNAKYWVKLVHQPAFGIGVQANNANGESKIVNYTKNIDEVDIQFPTLGFTSFETKEIEKVRFQVVNPTGRVVQTSGDCFLQINALNFIWCCVLIFMFVNCNFFK